MDFNGSIKPKMFWETYARYFLASKAIQEVCERLGIDSPTVLEIGANGEKYINQFLPSAVVIPLNPNPENVRIHCENLIVADASHMPEVPDNSFDFVVSCAVLEHIPPKLHKAVLSECYRVAKFGVFHGAPQESEQVNRAERTVSNFHELLHKVKHRWIEEHLLNGHPSAEALSLYCQELGLDYSIFEHMDCRLWTSMYCTYLEAVNYSGSFREYVNAYYQKELFFRDFGKFNVFIYLYIAKSGPKADEVLRDFKKGLSREGGDERLWETSDFQRHLENTMSRGREQTIINQAKLNEEHLKTAAQFMADQRDLQERYDQVLEEKEELSAKLNHLAKEYESQNQTCFELNEEIQNLKKQCSQIKTDLYAVKHSTSWKITSPMRRIGDLIRPKQ